MSKKKPTALDDLVAAILEHYPVTPTRPTSTQTTTRTSTQPIPLTIKQTETTVARAEAVGTHITSYPVDATKWTPSVLPQQLTDAYRHENNIALDIAFDYITTELKISIAGSTLDPRPTVHLTRATFTDTTTKQSRNCIVDKRVTHDYRDTFSCALNSDDVWHDLKRIADAATRAHAVRSAIRAFCELSVGNLDNYHFEEEMETQ